MTPPEYDATVHRLLGELVASVKNLDERLRRSEDKSDLSRSQMHGRLDVMIERVGKVESTVVVVQEDVKEMKPVVDEITQWKQRGIGGLFIVGIGASALTFLLTQYYNTLLAWISKG